MIKKNLNSISLIVVFVIHVLVGAEPKPSVQGSAEEIARYLYKEYYDFYWKEMPGFSDFVTTDFYALLLKEIKCKEVCAIDADPWIDAQDGEISEPITFVMESETEHESSINISYIFFISENQKRLQNLHMKFYRETKSQQWKLSDFITPIGNSLKKQIDDWHKKYGNIAEYEE